MKAFANILFILFILISLQFRIYTIIYREPMLTVEHYDFILLLVLCLTFFAVHLIVYNETFARSDLIVGFKSFCILSVLVTVIAFSSLFILEDILELNLDLWIPIRITVCLSLLLNSNVRNKLLSVTSISKQANWFSYFLAALAAGPAIDYNLVWILVIVTSFCLIPESIYERVSAAYLYIKNYASKHRSVFAFLIILIVFLVYLWATDFYLIKDFFNMNMVRAGGPGKITNAIQPLSRSTPHVKPPKSVVLEANSGSKNDQSKFIKGKKYTVFNFGNDSLDVLIKIGGAAGAGKLIYEAPVLEPPRAPSPPPFGDSVPPNDSNLNKPFSSDFKENKTT